MMTMMQNNQAGMPSSSQSLPSSLNPPSSQNLHVSMGGQGMPSVDPSLVTSKILQHGIWCDDILLGLPQGGLQQPGGYQGLRTPQQPLQQQGGHQQFPLDSQPTSMPPPAMGLKTLVPLGPVLLIKRLPISTLTVYLTVNLITV